MSRCHLDLEEVEEGAEAKVLEEEGDGVGSGLEDQLAPRRPVFVPIAGQLFLIGEDCLVFKQNALIVDRL